MNDHLQEYIPVYIWLNTRRHTHMSVMYTITRILRKEDSTPQRKVQKLGFREPSHIGDSTNPIIFGSRPWWSCSHFTHLRNVVIWCFFVNMVELSRLYPSSRILSRISQSKPVAWIWRSRQWRLIVSTLTKFFFYLALGIPLLCIYLLYASMQHDTPFLAKRPLGSFILSMALLRPTILSLSHSTSFIVLHTYIWVLNESSQNSPLWKLWMLGKWVDTWAIVQSIEWTCGELSGCARNWQEFTDLSSSLSW
mgnify:CR=1 FL=1